MWKRIVDTRWKVVSRYVRRRMDCFSSRELPKGPMGIVDTNQRPEWWQTRWSGMVWFWIAILDKRLCWTVCDEKRDCVLSY